MIDDSLADFMPVAMVAQVAEMLDGTSSALRFEVQYSLPLCLWLYTARGSLLTAPHLSFPYARQ